MALSPTAMLLVDCRGIVVRTEIERINEVAVRTGIVRFELNCSAEAGNRFLQFTHVLCNVADVVVNLGATRHQFPRAAVAGECFLQIALRLHAQPRLLCASAQSGFNSSARR